MANRADIMAKLGLDSSGFKNGLKKAQHNVKSFASGAVGQFARIGAAVGGVGLVKSIIGLGTAAAETASKFQAVFGPATDRMNESVKELRKTIPATTADVQNSLATFGQMARAFGFTDDAANDFSVSMTKISGDLASFHNLNPDEVFTKMSAAISGEFEPLKRLGIVINEATLKEQALEDGIWDGVGALNAHQKAVTVQTIVLKQMGAALGDAERTAGSAANQIKFLKAEIAETGTEIGVTTLPAVAKLTESMSWLLQKMSNGQERTGAILGKLFSSIENGRNVFADYESISSTTLKTTESLSTSISDAADAQDDLAVATENATRSLAEEAEQTERLKDQISEYLNKSKKATDLERERFVKGKELEVLKLRAKGEKAAADELENKIDSMKRAIDIADKYGISLRKAADLVEDINRAESSAAQKPKEVVKKAVELAKATQPKGIQTRGIRDSRKIGSGPSAAFLQKERDLGMYNTTLGRDLPKAFPAPSGMKAKAQESKADSRNLDEMNQSLTAIERELTKT